MSYSEMLKSPLWQRKRLEVLSRDDFKCRFCGDQLSELHVHHLIYLPDKKPWEYEDQYLVTLCHVCHLDEEKLKSEDKFLLGNIILAGISRRDLFSLASSLRTYFDMPDKSDRFLRLNDFLNE